MNTVQVLVPGSSPSLMRDAALLLVGGVVALTGKALVWDRYFGNVTTMGDLVDSLKRFLSSICRTLNQTLDDLARKFGQNEASINVFCQRHRLEVPGVLRDIAGGITAMVTRLDRTYKLSFTIKDSQQHKQLLGELSFQYDETRAAVEGFDVRVTLYSHDVYNALYPDDQLRRIVRTLRASDIDSDEPVPMYTGATPVEYRR